MSIKSLLTALVVSFSLAAPALAGSFIDGMVKAAEQGDARATYPPACDTCD